MARRKHTQAEWLKVKIAAIERDIIANPMAPMSAVARSHGVNPRTAQNAVAAWRGLLANPTTDEFRDCGRRIEEARGKAVMRAAAAFDGLPPPPRVAEMLAKMMETEHRAVGDLDDGKSEDAADADAPSDNCCEFEELAPGVVQRTPIRPSCTHAGVYRLDESTTVNA